MCVREQSVCGCLVLCECVIVHGIYRVIVYVLTFSKSIRIMSWSEYRKYQCIHQKES